MTRSAIIAISCVFILCSFAVNAARNKAGNAVAPTESKGKVSTGQIVTPTQNVSLGLVIDSPGNEFCGLSSQPGVGRTAESVIWLFIQSLIAGLLAVFTPYVYTIHPFTTGYLARYARSSGEKMRNSLIYAFSLVAIFMFLGFLIAAVIALTGIRKFTEHWIFNLFFGRTFLILGASFLGAFSLKLPKSWINSLAEKAGPKSVKGIVLMAVTLPLASFSSTFPIVVLVLLLAFNFGLRGPLVGMLGFSIGLALPFVFPAILKVFINNKSLLNNIKSTLGFFSLMIALKFLSNADISLHLNLVDRDLFITIWIALWAIMGLYMLGLLKLSNDIATEHNIYGQKYIPLSRLFTAIFAFVFALYLLPGIWGASLPGVNSFLPK